MYNEDLKKGFLHSRGFSIAAVRKCVALLNDVGDFENQFRKDFSLFSDYELKEVLPEVLGSSMMFQIDNLKFLRWYVDWCKSNTNLNVSDAILHYTIDEVSRIRGQMVSSPEDLNNYLNRFLRSPSKESVDDTTRGFLWLGFMGFTLDMATGIKAKDVDIIRGAIRNGTSWIKIYDEAMPVMKNLVELDHFNSYGNSVTKLSERPRIKNPYLLRGVKGEATKLGMTGIKSTTVKKVTAAVNNGEIDRSVTFDRVWFSGVFYRGYQRELDVRNKASFYAGREYEPDFLNDIETHTIDKRYTSKDSYLAAMKRWNADFRNEYKVWKEAFHLE